MHLINGTDHRITQAFKLSSRHLHVRCLHVAGHRHQERRAHRRGNTAEDNRGAVGSGKVWVRVAFQRERRGVAVCAFSYRRSVSFQIVTEGTRIVLPCTATGVPEPKHVWFNVSCLLTDSLLWLNRMLQGNKPHGL